MALINGGGEIVIGGYQDFGTRVLDLLAIVLVELVQNIKVKLIFFCLLLMQKRMQLKLI
jgi:hypothetical protein